MGWVARRMARNNGTAAFVVNALKDDAFRSLYFVLRQPDSHFAALIKRLELATKVTDGFDATAECEFVALVESQHPDTGTDPDPFDRLWGS